MQQKVEKNSILILSTIASFLNPFMGAAVNIALPKIGQEFALNAVSMSWITMAFLLSSAVSLVPMGKLADIVGRKRVFLLGNIIIVISSVLCAYSVSGIMLIDSRILQGIGSAMIVGTNMALITSVFPPNERGKAIGINVTAVYLGLSIAPISGGFFTQMFGWRSLFFLVIPIALFGAVTTYFFIKAEWLSDRNETFDYKGSVIYITAMSAFMYGFSKLPDLLAIAIACAGFAGLIVFVILELRLTFPVMEIRLFKNNRVFAFSNLAALINYAATFAITFVLSLYLQYVKGMSPRDAGMVLITQPMLMASVASFAGKMSDRYDSRILASLGMGIIVIGLLLLTFLSSSTSSLYIIISLVVLGAGFGIFSSPNSNSIMSSVDQSYLGLASATISTMRVTGQVISMGIATLIIHILMGESKISPENIDLLIKSVKIIFIVFTCLCMFGVYASLARGKKNK